MRTASEALTALLFVPGDRPERFGKAAQSGAGAVIIDFEDAVAPERKAAARNNLRLAPDRGVPILVRINGAATPWHDEDVAAVAASPCAAVLLPKVEDAEDLRSLRERAPDMPVYAMVESARGLASVRVLAAQPQVRGLVFGSLDFCADLGCRHLQEVLLPARNEIVLASRLTGLAAPIDGVTTEIFNQALVEREAQHAADLGFGGKLCIHPNQVAAVDRGFRPSALEIAWAEEVVSLGQSVAVLQGMMIDAPVRLRAERILRLKGGSNTGNTTAETTGRAR